MIRLVPPTYEQIRDAPKVLLHDHLDGGLRPQTIVELAEETGYEALPTRDPEELGAWMMHGADRKDLLLYLETFAHTVGVMQTPAHSRASRASAPRIWPPTASSTPKSASRRSSISSGGSASTRSSRPCRTGSATAPSERASASAPC